MAKYQPKAGKKPVTTSKLTNDAAGKIGNLECRKAVFSYLDDQKLRPASTKDKDMVPMLEELVGVAPAEIDDESDAYVWMVLTLVDAGEIKLPGLAYRAWCSQSRVKLVRAFMDGTKTDNDDEE